MEKLCKELDDVKAAMDKLMAENQAKTELSENLRKAHNEQLVKSKEAKLKIEKQAQDLNAKAEEITALKQMYEETKSDLHEKELALKQARFAHDKLRADDSEKLLALKGKNGELIFALDEANDRVEKQDQRINSFIDEIERIKGLLSTSQKKAREAEEKAQALKDMRQRDDMLMNLEEENMKTKEQLKWKKEQFKHLQEAHEKVQTQFRTYKKEWEQEKSEILDEICALQTRLESQTRISESLQYKLQTCNQALAHEESRRKLLEVQVSESKACYENVFVECQEAKSKIESLSVRRDDEIAHLRNLLGTKETLFKEAEYRREYLEQENQELRNSLKEFQEAQIKEAGSVSSLAKLKNKLKGLEQVHKNCLAKYSARETEWSSQMENIIADQNQCRSELVCKDRQIQELQIDLENCHSSILQLKLQNEEMHVMLTVYKCGLSDAHLTKPEVEVELLNKEVKEKIALLTEQLDQKNIALVKAHDMIEHEREIAVSLMRKVELLDPFEHKYLMTLKELENYKKMLEESSVQQVQLKEQSLQTEIALKENLRKVCDAFDKADSELVKTNQEVEDYKERLKESSAQQLQLKERALQTENALKEELRVVIDAFDKAKSDLAEKIQEAKTCNEMLQESSVQQLRLEEQVLQTENALKRNVSDVSNAFGEFDSVLAKKNQELENYKEVESLTMKELENYKQKLEESSLQNIQFKEQALQTEYSLKEDLKIVSDALNNVNCELAERIQELDVYKEVESLTVKELENYKQKLEESSLQHIQLKEQALHTEYSLKEDLKIASDALNNVNCELAERIQELDVYKEVESLTVKELENYKQKLEESSLQHIQLKEQALHTEYSLKEDLKIASDALNNVNCELSESIQDLEKYKEMLGDSLQQLRLKEQAAQTENALKEDLRIVSDTLNKVKSELAEKIHELENYEEMLEESSVMQLLLKEEALETEYALKEDLRIVSDALDKVSSELAEKIQEENEIEFELDRWKSAAEHLQCCLDENQVFRREMENSLLAQVETEQTLKQEKEHLLHLVEEKNKRVVAEFQEKQTCINALDEVCEKVLKTQVLCEFESQLRNLVILELEEEVTSLQKKIELQEISLSCTKHQVDQLGGALKAKQLEMEQVMDQLGIKLRISEDLAKTLLLEKRTLIQDVAKLSSERENLLSVVEEFSELVSGFYDKDTELAGRLGRIAENFDTGMELHLCLKENIECNDSNTQNENSAICFSAKNSEVVPDRRSPLVERN